MYSTDFNHGFKRVERVSTTWKLDRYNHIPPQPKRGRERRFEVGEQEKLLEMAKLYGDQIHSIILFATETAMRRGEIVKLRWKNIDQHKRIAKLEDTKNGESRVIPLSPGALKILDKLPRNISGKVFSMEAYSITRAFERCCKKAGLSGLRFHDLRHEATSRFFEMGFNIIEVSAITGHKDLAMLKRYTHFKAKDLAEKLDGASKDWVSIA